MADTNTLDLSDLSSEPVESNVQVVITDVPEEKEETESSEEVSVEEPVVSVEEPIIATPNPDLISVQVPEVVETETEVSTNISTEEVVENVKEILNSDNTICCNNCNCEERVKVLEEKIELIIAHLHKFEQSYVTTRMMYDDQIFIPKLELN